MSDEQVSGQEVTLPGPVWYGQAPPSQALAPDPRGPPEV
jgi:hypothetical protein